MLSPIFVSEKVRGLEDARYKVRNNQSIWRLFCEELEDGRIPSKGTKKLFL
jgi:hypothetical protein